MQCEHQSKGSVIVLVVEMVVDIEVVLLVVEESMQEETLCDCSGTGFSTSS